MPLYEDDTLEGVIRKAVRGERARLQNRSITGQLYGADTQFKQAKTLYRGRAATGEEIFYGDPVGDQIGQINTAFTDAARRLQSASDYLRTHGRDEIFNRYFGEDSASRESDVQTVSGEIDATKPIASGRNNGLFGVVATRRGDVVAEVLRDNSIVFYPPFFGRLLSSMARTVIHECGHIATNRIEARIESAGQAASVARGGSRSAMRIIETFVWYV